jgi:cell division protein FtsQ
MKSIFAGSRKKKIVLMTAAAVVTVTLLVLAVKHYGLGRCSGMEVYAAQGTLEYVSVKEVVDEVENKYGVQQGRRLSEIDVESIEAVVSEMPFVHRADVWLGIDGRLRIEITERRPIARVQNPKNEHFYINSDGSVIPVLPGKAARVVFASGYIIETIAPGLTFGGDTSGRTDELMKSPMYKVYVVASEIARNEFLKAQIDQIYFTKSGEIQLYPKVGRHVILFGDVDRTEEKFRMLQSFYKKSVFIEAWTKYDTINLKYRKQVICS